MPQVAVINGYDSRSSTSETVGISSLGKFVALSNASAIAVTLDSASMTAGLIDGTALLCQIANTGAGSATLTPTSGTINGQSSLVLATGHGGHLFFTGSNWIFVISGGGGSGGFVLNNISVGSDVCPHLRATAAGALTKVTAVLRRAITSTLTMTLYLDGNAACTINVPSSTAVDSIVAVTSFSYSIVLADSIFKLAITASDSTVDPLGVATVQMSWS